MRRLIRLKRHRLFWRLAAALILALALLTRIGYIVATPDFRPFADARDFDRVAVSLARHGDYPPSTIAPIGGPSGFRPPAYPYLLAAVYRITGTTTSTTRFTVARTLSALLSTLVVALTGLVAALLWGPVSAIVAMGLAAVYPPLVTIGDAMLSEPLFAVLSLGAVLTTLIARRSKHRLRWACVVGTLVGLAALTRTNGVVIALPLAAALWPRPWLTWRSLAPAAGVAAALLVVVMPWCIRNLTVFHQFVPITTQAGFTLAGTYNPISQADSSHPGAWRVPLMAPYARLLRRGPNEAQLSQAFQSGALHYAVHHPLYVAKVGYYNLGRLLGLEGPATELPAARESGLTDRVSNLDVYSFYGLAAITVAALLVGALRSVPAFVWLVPLFIAVSLVFVIAYMRYRVPIDPFLIVLASFFASGHVRAREMLRQAASTVAPRRQRS